MAIRLASMLVYFSWPGQGAKAEVYDGIQNMSRVIQLLQLGYADLRRSLGLWRYWFYRAIIQSNLRFKESRLGIVWPAVSLLFVVAVLGSVWGILLERKDIHFYFAYLVTGFPVWQVISGSVNAGMNSFPRLGGLMNIPITSTIFERCSRQLINLAYVLPLALVVPLLVGSSEFSNLIFIIPALVTITLWSWGVIVIVSIITLLRPDVSHLIKSIMRIMFLATPIIWEPSRLGDYQSYIWINPFFPVLEMGRYALSGIIHDHAVLWVAPLYGAAVMLLGFVMLSRYINIVRINVS